MMCNHVVIDGSHGLSVCGEALEMVFLVGVLMEFLMSTLFGKVGSVSVFMTGRRGAENTLHELFLVVFVIHTVVSSVHILNGKSGVIFWVNVHLAESH